MELSDLRRGWQRPAPADTAGPLDAAALTRLLTQSSRGPVAKMRRNAWVEIGVVAAALIGCIAAAVIAQEGFYLIMAAWLALICLLSGFYFRRKLLVLRSLGDVSDGAVREHMVQQVRSLRSLVQLYYRATVWSVPASFTIGIVFLGVRITQQFRGDKMMWGLVALGVMYVLAGVLACFGIASATRSYLQRLYGQHLDRLEASLRELEEPTT
jgi:hypothetical protein